MKLLTLEEHRIRKANILYAEQKAKKYLRRERIHDYLPGQVIYNLGEYPAPFSIRPTEYDYNLIKSLAEKGVGLIQLHEEWNDAIRVLGADKFTSHDPEGLKEFIKLCHDFGIKVIPYFSSCFFDVRDPDFTEKFSPKHQHNLDCSFFRYRMCDPDSAEWDEFSARKMDMFLNDYEFDGIFNDIGYYVDHSKVKNAFIDYDPIFEDQLSRIYSRVKEFGGIVKIHAGKCLAPKTKEKVYDYIWVGEGVDSVDDMLSTTQFDPYIIACPDFKYMDEKKEEEFYAKTIPFMQFILRVDGRPVTGEREEVPGIDYLRGKAHDEKVHYNRVKEWYKAHPDGPHVYSEWSSIPDNPEMRERWFEYFNLYKPMVEENSICYMDLTESEITKESLPKGVHMSLFVNEEVYLCISNLGNKTETIEFTDKWLDRHTKNVISSLTFDAGKMKFLKLVRE